MNISSFAAAISQNPPVAKEVRAALADLIPQMVRLNSALFSGATNPVIAEELNASATLTSHLYHLAEALDATPAPAEEKPKSPRKPKAPAQPAPTPVDPNNTPQPLKELPDDGALVVGEPTDSDKETAK